MVNLRAKSAGDGYPRTAIEKPVLRFLGSRTFSHSLDPMQTECSADLFGFASVERHAVVAEFDGGRMTSDAGALLLGERSDPRSAVSF